MMKMNEVQRMTTLKFILIGTPVYYFISPEAACLVGVAWAVAFDLRVAYLLRKGD